MTTKRRSLLPAFCILIIMIVVQILSNGLIQRSLLEGAGIPIEQAMLVDQIIATFFAFSIAFFSIELIRYFVWEGIYVRRTGFQASSILVQSGRIAIWAFTAFIVALTVFHQEFFAKFGFGAVSAGILWTLRGVASDLFTGLHFSITRPYKVGEWIRVGDTVGRVHEIKWTVTELNTTDNTLIYIPNSKLSAGIFENISRPSEAVRYSLTVHVAPTAPTQYVLTILNDAIKSLPPTESGKNPVIHPGGFTRDGRAFTLFGFADYYSHIPRLKGLARSTLFAALENAGIPITANLEYGGSVEKLPYSDPVDDAAILENTSIFSKLTKKELTGLASKAKTLVFIPGKHIITQGDSGDSIFIITRGSVKITINQEGEKPREVARLRAGHFFGEMSFLAGKPRGANVKTLTNVTVLKLSKVDIAPLIEKRPDLIREFSEIIAVREQQNKDILSVEEEDPASVIDDLISEITAFFRSK